MPGQIHILQVCLSGSWGGLEMVALEMAEYFQGKHTLTCTAAGSVLEAKLKERGLLGVALGGGKNSYFRQAFSIRKIIKNQKIDVVLVQQLHDLWCLRLAFLGLKKAPKVVGFSHTFVGVSKKDLLHRWSYGLVSKLVCMTSIHKKNLLAHLPVIEKQIQVIPNAVNTELFTPENAKETLRRKWQTQSQDILIGLVGRLDAGKGQDDLLQAALLLRNQKIQNFRILLIGEDTLNNQGTGEKLKDFVAEHQLEDVVVFTGFRSDIPEVIASLDILVMASIAETFGRVIIEGMASKVPVVATSGGGVADIIEDQVTGVLVPPQNPEHLARALSHLIENPELREKISVAGYQKAQKIYAEKVILPQVCDVIESVLN